MAHSAPFGISLDGLLAWQIREDAKAAARDAGIEDPPYDPALPPDELELPLARCEIAGDDGHWVATFAYPQGRYRARTSPRGSPARTSMHSTRCRPSCRRTSHTGRAATGPG